MKRVAVLITVFILLSLTLLSAGGNQEAQTPAELPTESVTVNGVSVSWQKNGEEMVFTLSAPTTGWVSLGIDPTSRMEGAQYVIGFVTSDGKGFVSDEWGTGAYSHAPDTSIGGSSDITLISSEESEGKTTLIFSLPIDSQDSFDRPLNAGEHTLLVAYGANGRDDTTSRHSKKGKAIVSF